MITVKMKPTKEILAKHRLEPKGPGQQFLASEVARYCDPYVPMDTGTMKNTREIHPDKVVYPQVYSKRQYHENKGSGLRGKLWDKRMWADRGREIVASVARFLGGEVR